MLHFNSHAHVERDRKVLKDCVQIFHFNSHAHVERDCIYSDRIVKICISTHTLTWSVTRNEYYSLKKINISTHTLTWSVTCKDDTVRIAGENFNSHAHVERDNLSTVQRLLK